MEARETFTSLEKYQKIRQDILKENPHKQYEDKRFNAYLDEYVIDGHTVTIGTATKGGIMRHVKALTDEQCDEMYRIYLINCERTKWILENLIIGRRYKFKNEWFITHDLKSQIWIAEEYKEFIYPGVITSVKFRNENYIDKEVISIDIINNVTIV